MNKFLSSESGMPASHIRVPRVSVSWFCPGSTPAFISIGGGIEQMEDLSCPVSAFQLNKKDILDSYIV